VLLNWYQSGWISNARKVLGKISKRIICIIIYQPLPKILKYLSYMFSYSVGDLGQTEWTVSTLAHIGKSDYDVLLLPGDLSYADSQQPLWDSFGRHIQPYASSRPWMVTEGNHEIEALTFLGMKSFIAYNHRLTNHSLS
jgi:Calcineurin-like phosphoesterase